MKKAYPRKKGAALVMTPGISRTDYDPSPSVLHQ